MPMVMCSEIVSWVRAACGVPVGMYMTCPGSNTRTPPRPSWRVHLPLLGPGGLQHEHVVGVLVDGEPLGPDRRQVGVGLAGMAEVELELGDQPGQRRPVAVQALEDDRRAVLEERERLARVDQAGERPAGQRRGRGCRSTRAAPSRRGPAAPTAYGSRSRSAGGRRPRGRGRPRARPARRGGGGPATPRPSRRRSGRHRSADRGGQRSGRVAVRGVGRVAVGAVGVAAVGAVGVAAVRAVVPSVPSASPHANRRRRPGRCPCRRRRGALRGGGHDASWSWMGLPRGYPPRSWRTRARSGGAASPGVLAGGRSPPPRCGRRRRACRGCWRRGPRRSWR